MSGEARPIDQFERNIELLSTSELGSTLVDAYSAAVELEPTLRNVTVIPTDLASRRSFFYAVPAWAESNQSGAHEIHVPLTNRERTIALLEAHTGEESQTVQLVANKLGINIQQMTPEMIVTYVLLHELGHTDEYRFFEANPDIYKARQAAEHRALPIPGPYNARELLVEGSATNLWATSEWTWQRLQQQWGVTTLKQLADLQQQLYKQLQSELYADHFAVRVLESRPELLRHKS